MRANCALGEGGDWRDAEVPKNSGPDLHYLQRENNRLSSRLDRYEQLLSTAYQLAGLVGAPERFLDAYSRPDEADPDGLLPVTLDELGEWG